MLKLAEESLELDPLDSVAERGPKLEDRYDELLEVVLPVEKYLRWSFEGLSASVGWRWGDGEKARSWPFSSWLAIFGDSWLSSIKQKRSLLLQLVACCRAGWRWWTRVCAEG